MNSCKKDRDEKIKSIVLNKMLKIIIPDSVEETKNLANHVRQ